jgi:hypothetical protein
LRINNLKKAKFRIIEKIPMKIAVIIESVKVARTFSVKDLLEKFPITKSREVLAINGPLKFPLKDKSAGIINIKTRKLSNGKISKERIIPARISPIIETSSDGKVSLIILDLESWVSI